MSKNIITIMTVLLIVFSSSPTFSEKTDFPAIKFDQGKVSIDVKDMPSYKVFNALERKTGIKIQMHKSCSTMKITSEIQAMPLREALRRLLKDFSYAIVENDREIEKIFIYSSNSTSDPLSTKDLGPSDSISTTLEVATQAAIPSGMEVYDPAASPPIIEGMDVALNNTPLLSMEPYDSDYNAIPEGMEAASEYDTLSGMQGYDDSLEANPSGMEIAPQIIQN